MTAQIITLPGSRPVRKANRTDGVNHPHNIVQISASGVQLQNGPSDLARASEALEASVRAFEGSGLTGDRQRVQTLLGVVMCRLLHSMANR